MRTPSYQPSPSFVVTCAVFALVQFLGLVLCQVAHGSPSSSAGQAALENVPGAPVITAPQCVAVTAPQLIALNTSATPTIAIADHGSVNVTVSLRVSDGTLDLPDVYAALLTAGTGTNDKVEVLSGPVRSVNFALASLQYQARAAGQPLSLDILSIAATGESGLSQVTQVNLFVTREALGGRATTVSLASLLPEGKTITTCSVSSWDSARLTSEPTVSTAGELTFTAVDGQDGKVVHSAIMVHEAYTDGTDGDVTIPVMVYHPLVTVRPSSQGARRPAADGQYTQDVEVVNTTPFPLRSFALLVPALPAGTVLQSASGLDATGVPFMSGPAPLAPGDDTVMTLQFHASAAKPFVTPIVRLFVRSALPSVTE